MSADDSWSVKHLATDCGVCGRTVSAMVAGSVTVDHGDDTRHVVSVMTCPNCGEAIVTSHSAMWNGGPDYEASAPHRVYPFPPRALSQEAPGGVRHDFDEAQLCYRAGAFSASAVMARRALEGIADELGANGRGLAAKMRWLREHGHIDQRLDEWARALKSLGDSAAHESGSQVAPEDAADVLTFAEALADYLFTYRRRFDAFMSRRNAPRIPPAPARPVDLQAVLDAAK